MHETFAILAESWKCKYLFLQNRCCCVLYSIYNMRWVMQVHIFIFIKEMLDIAGVCSIARVYNMCWVIQVDIFIFIKNMLVCALKHSCFSLLSPLFLSLSLSLSLCPWRSRGLWRIRRLAGGLPDGVSSYRQSLLPTTQGLSFPCILWPVEDLIHT